MVVAKSSTVCHQSWEYEPLIPRGLIVGIDGSAESLAALEFAETLARTRRCCLHAVMAIPVSASFQVVPGTDRTRDYIDRLRVTLKYGELREMLASAGFDGDWTCEIGVGHPAEVLAAVGESRAAEFVIVGRRQHGTIERAFTRETALQIMHLATVPVLAVHPGAGQVHTAVAAIDFQPASIAAAKSAVSLLGDDGRLFLVHVMPDADEAQARARELEEVAAEIAGDKSTTIETVVLTGSTVASVVAFAGEKKADLIASGSFTHSQLRRVFLGTVSTALVRTAQCHVLVAPPGHGHANR
jgi:nucleotide-binding universal stress UspA family protein